MKATVFDIQRNSYVDGPGIRTTVFFKGCNLRCAWCHNPESQLASPQMLIYADKCMGCGKCKEKCPKDLEGCDLCGTCEFYCPNGARKICGKEYTPEEILSVLLKDKAFYDASGGGITLSGGECMLYPEYVSALLKLCKEQGLQTAIDTAGHVPYESFLQVLEYTDIILYDVKHMSNDEHKKYTGVGNGLILENLKKLLKTDKRIWIRIPIIPTVNDSTEFISEVKAFFELNGKPERIELLPYHAMGDHKYTAIGRSAQSFTQPSDETMEQLKKFLM